MGSGLILATTSTHGMKKTAGGESVTCKRRGLEINEVPRGVKLLSHDVP